MIEVNNSQVRLSITHSKNDRVCRKICPLATPFHQPCQQIYHAIRNIQHFVQFWDAANIVNQHNFDSEINYRLILVEQSQTDSQLNNYFHH